MTLKKQSGFGAQDFNIAMKEVATPVTITMLINACIFATLNISSIPAVYITSRVALYCIASLYLVLMLCFPACCYLDMKRQSVRRCDVFFCFQETDDPAVGSRSAVADIRSTITYDYFYKPLVLHEDLSIRSLTNALILGIGLALIGISSWGITEREVGVGPVGLFRSANQAATWTLKQAESVAAWSIGMHWGVNDYTNTTVQMRMIKQFENVIATKNVVDVDTKRLWIAEFTMWATTLCEDNFGRNDFKKLACGRDQIFGNRSVCSATWTPNTLGLREQIFTEYGDEVCLSREGGICRPLSRLPPDDRLIIDPAFSVSPNASFCPTLEGWSADKWKFCLLQWRNITGSTNGAFRLEAGKGSDTNCSGVHNNDQEVTWPILYSSGPKMIAYEMFSYDELLSMTRETRKYCDDDGVLHCWLQGT